MRTVRWAQVALLAVVPACTHAGSGRVENASTAEANAGLPELSEATATADNTGINTLGSRTRFTYLGSASYVVQVPADNSYVYVDGTTCSPWSNDSDSSCTYEELVPRELR